MRKITSLFILLLLVGANSFSQTKSGTIYSEHEAIDKTKALWEAFVNGDEEKYRSFFADSAYLLQNGEAEDPVPNAKIGMGFSDWIENYENLMVGDQKPAAPDAMEYKEGVMWVSDWLLMTGIHKETGIILDVPIHNLYAFDKDGKISALIMYFDNDIFEEIENSQKTRENGKVYINHPYILTVRKAMNAFVAKDVDKWASFYSPKARFSTLFMQLEESMSIDEYKETMAKMFFKDDLKFKVEQVGYPDCIYYEKSDNYIVYSWWKMIYKKDGETFEYPFMVSYDFNDEGMIIYQNIYVSSNHLENLWK